MVKHTVVYNRFTIISRPCRLDYEGDTVFKTEETLNYASYILHPAKNMPWPVLHV
jgi:hypothetical protein